MRSQRFKLRRRKQGVRSCNPTIWSFWFVWSVWFLLMIFLRMEMILRRAQDGNASYAEKLRRPGRLRMEYLPRMHVGSGFRCLDFLFFLVYLVYLVCFVCQVSLVCLVSLVAGAKSCFFFPKISDEAYFACRLASLITLTTDGLSIAITSSLRCLWWGKLCKFGKCGVLSYRKTIFFPLSWKRYLYLRRLTSPSNIIDSFNSSRCPL